MVEARLAMTDEFTTSIVRAYTQWFGAPTHTVRFALKTPTTMDVAVVVYLPDDAEQKGPEGNITLLGTAGFSSAMICRDFKSEIGFEVKGPLDETNEHAMATALVELASVPLETGRQYEMNQILTNFSFPVFSRFRFAMLLDWDPIDGFRFPSIPEEIGLLRVLPLFEAEAKFVESFADRREGYLALFNRGLRPEDPNRGSVV